MAGIGWKLQGLVEQGTLCGAAQAYLTGVAVTSAPWLLTTAVVSLLRLGVTRGAPDAGPLITLAYAVAVVGTAPLQVVVSRVAADRLYQRHPEGIAAPLRRALGFTLVMFLLLGGGAAAVAGASRDLLVPAAMLTAVVAGQWLLVSVGSGLVPPGEVLLAFGTGALLGLGSAAGLQHREGWGGAGALVGMAAGQAVTFVWMLRAITRALPAAVDPDSPLLPAFSEYRGLALASLLFHASVWVDKLLVGLLRDWDAAGSYAAVGMLAWCSVLPAFGWSYVQVETTFYQRFARFFAAVERGACLAVLRQREAALRQEARRLLEGAARVQAVVLLLMLALAPQLLHALELPLAFTTALVLAAVGASLHFLTMLALLVLTYLDLRREALVVAVAQFSLQVLGTWACHLLDLPWPLQHVLASAVAGGLAVAVLHRRLGTLLRDTFQSQPYAGAGEG